MASYWSINWRILSFQFTDVLSIIMHYLIEGWNSSTQPHPSLNWLSHLVAKGGDKCLSLQWGVQMLLEVVIRGMKPLFVNISIGYRQY
jgi:hypothetical protein